MEQQSKFSFKGIEKTLPESNKPKKVGENFWYSPIKGKNGYLEEPDDIRIDCEKINGRYIWKAGGEEVTIKELEEIIGPNNWKNAMEIFPDFKEKIEATQEQEKIETKN
jgi:hypothetical protein